VGERFVRLQENDDVLLEIRVNVGVRPRVGGAHEAQEGSCRDDFVTNVDRAGPMPILLVSAAPIRA
jgi:hypothetical protein